MPPSALTILLPVVAILMFTGEWSQRSVFTTFTQEPRRIRVVNAKLAVSLLMGGGAAVFGGVVTAAGLGLASASGRALEANLTVGAITGYLLFVLLNVLAGVALGALLQSSATAIAACFALPAAFALLGTASTLVADWIDMVHNVELGARERLGRSRAADLGLGPLLGGGPARRRRRPDDTSRRHVAGSTGARLIEMCRRPGSHGRDRQGFVLFPPPQGGRRLGSWGTAQRNEAGRQRAQPGHRGGDGVPDGSRRVVALPRRDGRLKRVRGRLDHQDLRRHRALGDWSIGCAADRTTATFRILHGSSSQA